MIDQTKYPYVPKGVPLEDIDDRHPSEIEMEETEKVFWRIHWGEIAQATLPRFPELQRGETIHVREIKRRLREIREVNYDVEAYSHMNKEQAWDYLKEIRRDVYEQAEKHCPEIVRDIRRANSQSTLDAHL